MLQDMATVYEMSPMIAVMSAKAQGSKVKPVKGSEPTRATRARDKATQRMTNILAHLVPHQGDPTSSSFVSECRLGGFLHSPLWAGIYPSGSFEQITQERSVKPPGLDLTGGGGTGGISPYLIPWLGTCPG
jgi:hypothetical protein